MVRNLGEVLTRAAEGDAAAREILIAEIYPRVERLVHARLAQDVRPKNRWILPLFSTGDIVQEVFLGVIEGLSGFADKSEDELLAWTATQVRNRILDRLRFHGAACRNARLDVHATGGAPEIEETAATTPSAQAILEERALLLDQALSELDAREHRLWRLRFEEERSFAAVAQDMDYANAESARAAFRALRARLTVRLRRLGLRPDRAEP